MIVEGKGKFWGVTNGTLIHSCARATGSSQITLGMTCLLITSAEKKLF